MKTFLTNLSLSSLFGTALVLPLAFMEWFNRRSFNETFPLAIFGFLWLVPIFFGLILLPLIRDFRQGNSLLARPVRLLISLAVLILLALGWVNLLLDQMPCFWGVPNCD